MQELETVLTVISKPVEISFCCEACGMETNIRIDDFLGELGITMERLYYEEDNLVCECKSCRRENKIYQIEWD